MVIVYIAESGKAKSPRVRTRFSLGVQNEQTDAGRDGRVCLARPIPLARTGFCLIS